MSLISNLGMFLFVQGPYACVPWTSDLTLGVMYVDENGVEHCSEAAPRGALETRDIAGIGCIPLGTTSM